MATGGVFDLIIGDAKTHAEAIDLMNVLYPKQCELVHDRHVLLCLSNPVALFTEEVEFLKNNFYGVVLTSMDAFDAHCLDPVAVVYLCGDNGQFKANITNTVLTIHELSYNTSERSTFVSLGAVPISVHGVGVYLRRAFDERDNCEYFGAISAEHEFQDLGESNKPGVAYRKGIYLTGVKESDQGTEFNLLRCSSNLHGPTCNFKETDKKIIATVNEAARRLFANPADLNHVLAQIYVNQRLGNKERKAKIKEHSDKTKDMPSNALFAFCSFYKDYAGGSFRSEPVQHRRTFQPKPSSFDFMYKNNSCLTKLRFRLKDDVPNDAGTLKKCFDIVLYPNSLFMMPLETNRLYTHEIIPSVLPIDKLPTRMGYVVRCSNTTAVHRTGQTYVIDGGAEVELKKITNDDIVAQRRLYWIENSTSQTVNYPPTYFSMNQGDYQCPKL